MELPAIWPYVLGAVLLFALVLIVLLVMLLRKASKSSEFVDAEEMEEEEAPAAKEPREAGPIADVAGAFRKAAKYIDRAADGDRKNVPLFLLVGDQGARDSDLLANAGIDLTWGLPEEAGTALGEGRGFWVFDRGVVLDVAGDDADWDDVVAHLQRLRPKRPVDGVIVALSCSELLDAVGSEAKRTDLAARAGKTYRKLWDAQTRLGFRLPAYILVTGCEKVTGFRALASSLHEQSRRQIVGWSNPNGIETVYRGQWIDEAFETMARRLDDVTMEVFAEGTSEGDQLVRFTPSMMQLQNAVRMTLDSLFKSSAYHGSLIFRGLYFCGRETEPATEDMPPSGDVAFLAEVLDRKVFIEHRLAAPTARTVMARNRSVSIAKSMAAACLAVALVSLAWSAYKFRRENLILVPVLSGAAEAMETTMGREPSVQELSQNAINLLNGMAAIDFDRYDSLVVPASWFKPYQPSLEHAFSDAFHDIILRAIRADLKTKSRNLVPLDDPRLVPFTPETPAATGPLVAPSAIIPATMTSSIVPSSTVTVEAFPVGGGQAILPDQDRRDLLSSTTDDGGAPAWVDNRLTPIGTMPEFMALRTFIAQMKELDQQINGFNKLRETGDLRQVGRLVKYSWGIDLPESFFRKSHLYRHALLNAQYEPLRAKPDFQAATQRKLTRLANEFHDALFRRNPFGARLQRLSSTIQNVTWQPPSAGDTAPLQAVAEQLKRIDSDLSGPELEWAFKREFDLGPDYNAMLGDMNATSYLGIAASRQMRDATAARWGRFQQGLTWASSPLTKTILSVHEDRPEMHLSKESLLLQSALQTFLGQSFVASARRPGPLKTDLTEGYRLNWNTTSLEQAVAVAHAYDRFRSSTLLLFPPDVRVSIDQVARERALGDMLDSITRARLEEAVAYVESPSEREEQIRLDVARFNALVPQLETVLDVSSKLSPEAGRLIAASMSAEAYRVLRNIDGLLERDRPYSTLEDIAQWDGGVPPSPRVWGKSDEAELTSWLEATRGRIAFVAMNYARPPLAWLSKSQMANRPDMRDLITAWQAIVDDVRDHETKKPGNSIAVLEEYIGVRMAKVTANDCTAATLPTGFRGRSFFGLTAQDLSRRVRGRCLELAGRDATSRYAKLERYFNQRLAGRYPFSENLPKPSETEADPTDVRTFFRMFDENKAALIAPAAQGGLDADEAVLRKWVDDMSKVRVFFAPFLDAPKPELVPSLDLEATFRVLKQREVDGQQIAGWSLSVGDQTITNRHAAKKVRWTAGQPVRLALRWANDAPRVPVTTGQRATLAEERTVVWEYTNRWSLLTALADHPTRSEELPEYQDVLPVTMGFDLASKPVDGTQSDVTPARVFMRLALLAPGTNQPVDLPRFPVRAPRFEATKEAAR
ncbi:MAG TPA: type VI secretion system protein [Thermoanaerobaculia bacterium]|nr:type VI secretion system protein [Thermoanaerobaculia bacterium]